MLVTGFEAFPSPVRETLDRPSGLAAVAQNKQRPSTLLLTLSLLFAVLWQIAVLLWIMINIGFSDSIQAALDETTSVVWSSIAFLLLIATWLIACVVWLRAEKPFAYRTSIITLSLLVLFEVAGLAYGAELVVVLPLVAVGLPAIISLWLRRHEARAGSAQLRGGKEVG
jgi:hypothetical protein